MKYYLRCNGSGRGECGEVFDTIETATSVDHACEWDGDPSNKPDPEDRPDYTIVSEDEAF